MVYIVKDGRGGYTFRVIEALDGPDAIAGAQRVINESMGGFEAPNQIFPLIELMKEAIKQGHVRYGIDKEATGTFGYQIYAPNSSGQMEIIDEAYGWMDDTEAKQQVAILYKALCEGTKFIMEAPIKRSKETFDSIKAPDDIKIDFNSIRQDMNASDWDANLRK